MRFFDVITQASKFFGTPIASFDFEIAHRENLHCAMR